MTIKEAFLQLVRSDETEERFIDLKGIAQCFQLYDWIEQDETNPRFRVYWLKTWYCTDTWVGYRAWFLDDELVAMTYQAGRKYDEEFSWVSKEAYDKSRKVIHELHSNMTNDDDMINFMSEEDWNTELKH